MRLLDRLTRRVDVTEADERAASLLSWAFGAPNDERILPTFQSNVDAYASSSVVFGVMLARLMLFSEVELKFQDLDDEHLFRDADLDKLVEPWPGATTGELLARMEQDVSLAGNAFIRDAGSQLERLRPDWVTIISELVTDPVTDTQVRRVLGYGYTPLGDTERGDAFYPVNEVAHWSPIPDPIASFRGMSWLTPVLREVDADLSLTDYKRAYLTNAATPNMLIKYAKKIEQTRIDRLSEQIKARHGGTDNAFRTLILDEGADVTVLGNSFEQMTFTAVQAAGENRIAVAAGVPGIVAGLKEGLSAATYSNYEQAMRRFADLYGRPHWRSACGALSKLVVLPANSRLWYDTSGVAALRQGDKERADTMQVLATAASTLITAGYTAESVSNSLAAGDVTLLEHSGLVSVQLQKPGEGEAEGGDAPAPAATSEQDSAARLIQQIYLGVGKVVTVAEARTILQKAGVDLGTVDIDLATLHENLPPMPAAAGDEAGRTFDLAEVVRNASPSHTFHVHPTPVEVDARAEVTVPDQPVPEVTVQVNPTPVDVHNEITVEPADVQVLPTEPKTRKVVRDAAGNIAEVHEE